jgi:hypothetical protein
MKHDGTREHSQFCKENEVYENRQKVVKISGQKIKRTRNEEDRHCEIYTKIERNL